MDNSSSEVKAARKGASGRESVGFQRPAAVKAKADKVEAKQKHRRRSVSCSPMKLRVRAGVGLWVRL